MSKRLRVALTALVIMSVPAVAHAGVTSCPEHFLGGSAPDVVNPSMARGAVSLCNAGYSLIYSPISMGPLASAEHLTPARIASARGVKRENRFHPESRLPPEMQMQLSDWKTPGYCSDRGHMANNGDMPDANSAYESFSLANMIPQDTDNNERLWEGIESAVRDLTVRTGDVYVVTGPIFDKGATLKRLNGKILVPSRIYKAYYVQATGETGVYMTLNAAGEQMWSISVNQLKDLTGIDVFPALPKAAKDHVAQLAAPQSHFHSNREMKGSCTPLEAAAQAPAGAFSGGPQAQQVSAYHPSDAERAAMAFARKLFQ